MMRRRLVPAQVTQGGGEVDIANPGFARGLDFARANDTADLLHLLFSTRSRVVTGQMPKGEAASYLSGLMLGKDIGSARTLLDLKGPVQLICTPGLAALYSRALSAYDLASAAIDGDEAALAGLVHAHAEIFS